MYFNSAVRERDIRAYRDYFQFLFVFASTELIYFVMRIQQGRGTRNQRRRTCSWPGDLLARALFFIILIKLKN